MVDAHNVRKSLDIEFGDGVTRTVYPLSLKALRKFVKILDKMSDTQDIATMTEEDVDLMVDATEIILAKVDSKLVADRDLLEDAVDVDIFGKLMQVAMGNASPEA